MKILHVISSARAEGTPRLALDWLESGLYSQEVLFLDNSNKDLLPYFDKQNAKITFSSSNVRNCNFFKRAYKITKTVYDYCKINRPDLIIAWDQANVHYILAGGKLAAIKKLIGHAGVSALDDSKGFKIHWYTYLVFFTIRLINAVVICPSFHIQKSFFDIPFFPKSTLKVVNNSINVKRFISENSYTRNLVKKYTAIMVANLEEAKDHHLLLESWKNVVKTIPEATLYLAGGGSLKNELTTQCENLKITKNVIFLGPISNVPDYLWSVQLYLFTSKPAEGFGTVLIEALAAGMKIISFDAPAPREVLKGGEFGTLVPSRDPALFAKIVIEEFNKEDDAQTIKKRIEYAADFSIENMIKGYFKQVDIHT